MLRAAWNKYKKDIPKKIYCMTTCFLSQKSIQVGRTGHAEQCWQNKNERMDNVFFVIITFGHTGVGQLTRTNIISVQTMDAV